MGEFKDKVVIVTGSGRGIGKLTAQKLALEGAKIVVADVNEENAMKSATDINESGGDAIAVVTDVSNEIDVMNMVEVTIRNYKTVDVLINNAGFTRDNLIENMTVQNWDSVLDTCLKGTFLCTKYVSPSMIEKISGKIVNIASISYLGNMGQANYSSAKAGLVGFTKAMAKELGRYSINVNAIAPGLTETEALKRLPKYEMIKERVLKSTPIRRLGMPEDVVNAIMFLASEKSSYVTGDVIHVSGGRFG